MFLRKIFQQGPSFKQKFQVSQEILSRESDSSTSFLLKDKGSRDIMHNMNVVLDTRKSNFLSQQWFWFHMVLFHHDTLPQNTTATLLQNATNLYSECDRLFITKCDSFNVCNVYYQMCRYNKLNNVNLSSKHSPKIIHLPLIITIRYDETL